MSSDGPSFDWKKLSLDLIFWSSCTEMSHDAFAYFIQPGPPRISMCELLNLHQFWGRGKCQICHYLKFPVHSLSHWVSLFVSSRRKWCRERGGEAKVLPRWRMWQKIPAESWGPTGYHLPSRTEKELNSTTQEEDSM